MFTVFLRIDVYFWHSEFSTWVSHLFFHFIIRKIEGNTVANGINLNKYKKYWKRKISGLQNALDHVILSEHRSILFILADLILLGCSLQFIYMHTFLQYCVLLSYMGWYFTRKMYLSKLIGFMHILFSHVSSKIKTESIFGYIFSAYIKCSYKLQKYRKGCLFSVTKVADLTSHTISERNNI